MLFQPQQNRRRKLLLSFYFYELPDQLSVKKILDLFASAGVSQLSESFSLNLADAFTCNVEFFAHFLKGTASAVFQTKAQSEDLSLIHI